MADIIPTNQLPTNETTPVITSTGDNAVATPVEEEHLTKEQKEQRASVKPPSTKKDQRISTQNHLLFAEIRDGIIIMRDGSLRMVIMASALNFDLKSPQEQDAIEFSYQNFLNGLHFPVQIVVRSRKIDLDNYIDNLEHLQADLDNPLLASLMEDYIFNIRSLLEEVNIMSKEFYVVVPYYVEVLSKDNIVTKIGKIFKPNEDYTQTTEQFIERKRDLLQRTNMIQQSLAQLGVRSAILSTQELIELFYTSYNQDESQFQSLINVDDMTTPAVTRKGSQPQPMATAPSEPEPDDLFSAATKTPASPSPQPANDQASMPTASPTPPATNTYPVSPTPPVTNIPPANTETPSQTYGQSIPPAADNTYQPQASTMPETNPYYQPGSNYNPSTTMPTNPLESQPDQNQQNGGGNS